MDQSYFITNNNNNNNNNNTQPFFPEANENCCNNSELNEEHTYSNVTDNIEALCEHNIIVEDYVETGVDSNMIKIRYCQICELTF